MSCEITADLFMIGKQCIHLTNHNNMVNTKCNKNKSNSFSKLLGREINKLP